MFSILVPSRERKYQLEKLIENIGTTVNIEDIELLVKQDDDSKYTTIVAPNKFMIASKVFVAPRSEYLNRDYYNYLAQVAKGDYLWAIGDDVRVLTRNWNIILKERIEEYLKDKPDRIAYISVNEVNSRAKHPCFPLITKEAFQALGMYFHPDLMSWGADRCLYELYSGINRMLHIPEVEIQHLSYHDNSGVFDETAKSMKERFFRDPNCHNKVCSDIIPKQIEKLKQIINNIKEK